MRSPPPSSALKVCFYIAQYPVRWTAQTALHSSSPGRPVHSDTNSTSLGIIEIIKAAHDTTSSRGMARIMCWKMTNVADQSQVVVCWGTIARYYQVQLHMSIEETVQIPRRVC